MKMTTEPTIKSILAALTHDDARDPVYHTACLIARQLGATLWLLEVTPPDPDFVGLDVGPESVRQSLAHELAEHHRNLQALAEEARRQGIDAHAVMVSGATLDSIVEAASRHEADLLIVGNPRHGWLHQLLQGSASEQLARTVSIPVMLVPSRTS